MGIAQHPPPQASARSRGEPPCWLESLTNPEARMKTAAIVLVTLALVFAVCINDCQGAPSDWFKVLQPGLTVMSKRSYHLDHNKVQMMADNDLSVHNMLKKALPVSDLKDLMVSKKASDLKDLMVSKKASDLKGLMVSKKASDLEDLMVSKKASDLKDLMVSKKALPENVVVSKKALPVSDHHKELLVS